MRAVSVSPAGARLCAARRHRHRRPPAPSSTRLGHDEGAGSRRLPWGPSDAAAAGRGHPCRAVPAGSDPGAKGTAALRARPGLQGCAKDRRGRKTYGRKTGPRARHCPGEWSSRGAMGARSAPGSEPFPSHEWHGQCAPPPAVAEADCFHARSVQGENSPRSSAFISRQRCINPGPLRQGNGGSSAGPAAPRPPAPAVAPRAAPRRAAAPRPAGGSMPRCWPGERVPLRGAFLTSSFI